MNLERNLLTKVADGAARQRALKSFGNLLNSSTKEADWQKFFDGHPFVLSDALPLRFDGLFRQVPLATGIPDYVFQRGLQTGPLGDYGVIELKRPTDAILGRYSSKIVVASGKLKAAQQQVTLHMESIRRGSFLRDDDFFVAGNRGHAFIIMGGSHEVIEKCKNEVIRAQFVNILPLGFHLYTYDELYKLFAASLAPTLYILNGGLAGYNPLILTRILTVTWREGIIARAASQIARLVDALKVPVFAEKDEEEVDAKDMLGIMMLGAGKGSKVKFTATGMDALTALDAIEELFVNSCFLGERNSEMSIDGILHKIGKGASEEVLKERLNKKFSEFEKEACGDELWLPYYALIRKPDEGDEGGKTPKAIKALEVEIDKFVENKNIVEQFYKCVKERAAADAGKDNYRMSADRYWRDAMRNVPRKKTVDW